MALLKSYTTTPPGGWQYFQTETEFTIKGDCWSELVDLVLAHRRYRNLQPQDKPAVELEIQRQMCRKLGKGECRSEGPQDKWLPLPHEKNMLTMEMVLAFSKAAIAFVASGGELAPMEEVKRRAAICRHCLFNSQLSGCRCQPFYALLDKTIPRDRRMPDMGVCKVCSCSNLVKVNLTDEQVRISNEGRDLQWPQDQECWQARIMQDAASGET